MSTGNLATDLDAMAKGLSSMKGHHVRKATARAIERTLIAARHAATTEVEKKDKVKKHLIKNKTKIRKPKWKKLEGSLDIYQSPIPLISTVTNRGKLNTKRLVGLEGRKYKNKQALGGTRVKARGANRFYHRGFINRIKKTGQIHLLQRHGKATYKVRVPKIMVHKTMNKVTPRALAHAESTTFNKVLEHEYTRRWNNIVK